MSDAHDRSVDLAVGTAGQRPVAGLARDLSELARELQADATVDAMLRRITATAVAEIEHAEWAGISEIAGKRVDTRAATDPRVERVDEAQHRFGEGPCLTSLRSEETVRCDDLGDETRWPEFAAAALGEGVRSTLSVQLFVADDNLGALNLYSARSGAFDADDESTAMLLAAHAAVAMKAAKVKSNMSVALDSRDVIGQGKGVLMERYKIGAAEAFDLLVMASQRTHRKLREVAEELAATGELRID